MLIGAPSRNDPDRVRVTVRVHDYEQVSKAAKAETDESSLVDVVGIVTGQREIILQYGNRLGEAHFMNAQVGSCLRWIPFESHTAIV